MIFFRIRQKLYMLKNGGTIKHWDKEELLPLSQWTIKSPVEYAEKYLGGEIEGSNMHRTLEIERFVKDNSSDERREYWSKFVCFAKGMSSIFDFNVSFFTRGWI